MPFVTFVVAGGAIALAGAPAIAAPGALAAKAPVTPVPAKSAELSAHVSTAAVSAIVGFTLPAPTASGETYAVDKAIGLQATATDCSYSTPISATDYSPKEVNLSSEVFNKPVSLALLRTIAAQEQKTLASKEKASGFKETFSTYSGLGVTAIFFTVTAKLNFHLPTGVTLPKSIPTTLAFEGIATLQGTISYGASVNNTSLPQSKLADLVRLAMKL